jgi:hypothetical protein
MQIRTLLGAAALAASLGTACGLAYAQANAAASQEELLFWDTIKSSSNPSDFQEYLKQYPNGRFAGLARIRIQSASIPAKPDTRRGAAAAVKTISPEAEAALKGAVEAPAAGDRWTYQYTDRKYGRKQQPFTVRVDGIDGALVNESIEPLGGQAAQRKIDLRVLRFAQQALPAERTLVEFSPYLTAMDRPPTLPLKMRSGSGYPIGAASSGDWQVVITSLPGARVTVPAGTFSALAFQVKGDRRAQFGLERFQLVAWYAPESKRYVRLEHKRWNGGNLLTTDELVELVDLPRR